MKQSAGEVNLDPNKLAVLYYFGDLSYWQLPKIAGEALELVLMAPRYEDWQG
jgi:hypothetical protein